MAIKVTEYSTEGRLL